VPFKCSMLMSRKSMSENAMAVLHMPAMCGMVSRRCCTTSAVLATSSSRHFDRTESTEAIDSEAARCNSSALSCWTLQSGGRDLRINAVTREALGETVDKERDVVRNVTR
jgi:hypothetical protein